MKETLFIPKRHRSLGAAFDTIEDLLEALRKARETIHALHGDAAWEIYEKHSPEMREIDAALSNASKFVS
jgi:ABC-type nitrate/sulfonate/bicarbonate transport system substrate-binding protein